MTDLKLVDMAGLRGRLAEDRNAYASNHPYPHLVVDDVLDPTAFKEVATSFPAVDDDFWRGYLHVNETKYCNVKPDTWAEPLQDLAHELTSPEFVRYLEELTGIEGLLPDWSMDGGGLHQTLRGGHLNVHTDFTTHHVHQNWARRVNVLFYLNEEWPAEWGGQLELWDTEMTAPQARVSPAGNRMLVFTTSMDSYHGHPDPLTCPEGEARRSMALYYFTEEEAPERRATHYRPRPDDGAKKVAIVADRFAVDVYDRLKRRLGLDDDATQRAMQRIDRLRKRLRRR